jgi:hypothetical protein
MTVNNRRDLVEERPFRRDGRTDLSRAAVPSKLRAALQSVMPVFTLDGAHIGIVDP